MFPPVVFTLTLNALADTISRICIPVPFRVSSASPPDDTPLIDTVSAVVNPCCPVVLITVVFPDESILTIVPKV